MIMLNVKSAKDICKRYTLFSWVKCFSTSKWCLYQQLITCNILRVTILYTTMTVGRFGTNISLTVPSLQISSKIWCSEKDYQTADRDLLTWHCSHQVQPERHVGLFEVWNSISSRNIQYQKTFNLQFLIQMIRISIWPIVLHTFHQKRGYWNELLWILRYPFSVSNMTITVGKSPSQYQIWPLRQGKSPSKYQIWPLRQGKPNQN